MSKRCPVDRSRPLALDPSSPLCLSQTSRVPSAEIDGLKAWSIRRGITVVGRVTRVVVSAVTCLT